MSILSIADRLTDQANGLALIAESSEAVAKHFRPRFEACWEDGKLIDSNTALRLRFYVIDKEAEAKQWRSEEAELREAVALLLASSVSRPHLSTPEKSNG